jgi:multidrug efflux system membrane fusion protein
MNRRMRLFVPALLLALTGCSSGGPAAQEAPPPLSVPVSAPVQRKVIDYAEFTGRTSAVQSVRVRSRIWGHIDKIHFVEGAEVKKGDLLFVIDPRPYRTALARAEADLAQSEARSARLSSERDRGRSLLPTRAMSREEFDKTSGDLLESQAAVRAAKAGLATAKLNLDYTEVRAPVDGQVSRALVTVGNLVMSGENGGTILTTLVSVDPVYVYFDVDDLTYLNVRKLLRAGMNGSVNSHPIIQLGLTHQGDYPYRGTIDFMDNQVDPATGTMKMRGVFSNKDRELTPGLFARVRVALGPPHDAILVSDRAIDTDQGQKVLYVVGKVKIVERRLVRLGGLHEGMREILSGVKPGEHVVVDAIQRVRPGMSVEPRVVEMPGLLDARRSGPNGKASQS